MYCEIIHKHSPVQLLDQNFLQEGGVMKHYVTIASVFIVTILLIAFMGCEGEKGPTGSQGADGDSGTAACGACHDVSTSVLAKQMQWEQSGHATGTAYGRGTSASCAPCHSSEGFTVKIAGGTVEGVAAPTPPNCRTCHNIHMNYDTTDYALATTDAVELTGDIPMNATFDMGKGNLCVNCHQTRERNYGLDPNGSGEIEINSSHWGPHHGPQSNILLGVGGFEVSGSVSYEHSPHKTLVEDGCVTCHMFDDSHTFEPDDDACESCHGGDFDYEAKQTEIAELYEELNQALVKEGILAGDAEEGYHPVSGQTTTMAKAGALFNARIFADEGSMGVHNFKYSKALLQNSIEVFE